MRVTSVPPLKAMAPSVAMSVARIVLISPVDMVDMEPQPWSNPRSMDPLLCPWPVREEGKDMLDLGSISNRRQRSPRALLRISIATTTTTAPTTTTTVTTAAATTTAATQTTTTTTLCRMRRATRMRFSRQIARKCSTRQGNNINIWPRGKS